MIKGDVVFENECIYINDKYWIDTENGNFPVRLLGDDPTVIRDGECLESIKWCMEN